MRVAQRLHALWRGDEADVLHPPGTPLLQDVDRRDRRAARRQHRIEHEAHLRRHRRRELVVILDRPQRALIAEQADVPYLRLRDELQGGLDHADPRAQYRDQPDGFR